MRAGEDRERWLTDDQERDRVTERQETRKTRDTCGMFVVGDFGCVL